MKPAFGVLPPALARAAERNCPCSLLWCLLDRNPRLPDARPAVALDCREQFLRVRTAAMDERRTQLPVPDRPQHARVNGRREDSNEPVGPPADRRRDEALERSRA